MTKIKKIEIYNVSLNVNFSTAPVVQEFNIDPITDQRSSIKSLSYSPDGNYLAAASLFELENTYKILVWHLPTGILQQTVYANKELAETLVDQVVYSPDNKHFSVSAIIESNPAVITYEHNRPTLQQLFKDVASKLQS